MDNEMLSNIIILANDKKLNGEKLKKLMEKECRLVNEINKSSFKRADKIKKSLLLPMTFITGLKALYQEDYDIKRREKILSQVLNVNPEFITGDFVTFVDSPRCYPFFVDDFQYNGSVSLDRMKTLMLVWGNADLKKLHDFSNVSSLKVVMGDLYISTGKNTDGLSNLDVVTGDIHMEQIDNVDFLNSSLYVGGNVYTKQGIYKMNEKEKVQTMKK